MARTIPDWMPSASWFVAGVFATGSLWYFLAQGHDVGTALSAVGAFVFVGLAIYLHRAHDRAARNASLRRQLAALLAEAQGLRLRLNEQPLPVAEHNAWVERAATYLRETLGPEFEVRFSDFSGMVFYGDGSERSEMSRSLEGRSRRLREFIAELGG